jgi:hypothetical protein
MNQIPNPNFPRNMPSVQIPNPNFPRNMQSVNNNQSNFINNNNNQYPIMNNIQVNPFENIKKIKKFDVNCSKLDCIWPAEYLCEDCNKLCCSNCFYENHNNHLIQELKETLDTQEKSFTWFEGRFYEFKNNRNKIREKEEYINKMKSESQKRIDELSNLKRLIDENIAYEKQMTQIKANFFNEVYSKEIDGKKKMVEFSIIKGILIYLISAKSIMEYYENEWKKMTEKDKIIGLTKEDNKLLRNSGGGLFDQFVISYSEINNQTEQLFERMDRFNRHFCTEESISDIGSELVKLKGTMENIKPENFYSLYENANPNYAADNNSNKINRNKSWEKEKENVQVKNFQNDAKPNNNKYERFYFISPYNLSEIIVLSFRERSIKSYSISQNKSKLSLIHRIKPIQRFSQIREFR